MKVKSPFVKSDKVFQALSRPIIQMAKEMTPAVPQRIPADLTKTSLAGNALNISIIDENIHPPKPAIRMTDQKSCSIFDTISPGYVKSTRSGEVSKPSAPLL